MNDLLTGLDRALTEPVVVYGSLPPDARDIDVVARDAQSDELAAAMDRDGFVRRGHQRARFDGNGAAVVVDVRSPARLGLTTAAARELFAEALPIGGLQNVRRPAPAHVVLLLARRVAREGRLDGRRRARLEAAIAEDPLAWSVAERLAPSWNAVDEVDFMARARGGAVRARRNRLRQAKHRLGAPRRGAVVSLSGLDGSGKSTQAERLRVSLGAAGVDSVVLWSRLSHDAALGRIAAAAQRVRRPLANRDRRATVEPATASTGAWKRSATSRAIWPLVVAAMNVRAHLRVVPHVAAGRVVICDRFQLDSVVQLRDKYGEGSTTGVACRVVRWFSPSPLAAFLLDVPPEVALSRKVDDYDVDALGAQAALYRRTAREFGVTMLDGSADAGDITAQLAREVWVRLR